MQNHEEKKSEKSENPRFYGQNIKINLAPYSRSITLQRDHEKHYGGIAVNAFSLQFIPHDHHSTATAHLHSPASSPQR
jgi:hypothetical protein